MTCEDRRLGVWGCVIVCEVGYPVVVGDGREHDGGNGCEGGLASSEDGVAKLVEATIEFAATRGTTARTNARKDTKKALKECGNGHEHETQALVLACNSF